MRRLLPYAPQPHMKSNVQELSPPSTILLRKSVRCLLQAWKSTVGCDRSDHARSDPELTVVKAVEPLSLGDCIRIVHCRHEDGWRGNAARLVQKVEFIRFRRSHDISYVTTAMILRVCRTT